MSELYFDTIQNQLNTLKMIDEQNENQSNISDPLCDPECPRVIHFEDVTSAAFKIRSSIVKTPCTLSQLDSSMTLYFKKDYLQYTGSFKERGASYALLMLSKEQRERGVISASLGNHALALSYHGKRLNIPISVVMPVTAPIMKIQACCKMNANIIIHGNDMAEAKQFALIKGQELGQVYINGYDHPMIMAGQGTVGLEVMEDVQDVDAVIVPVGGGGLIAGVATAVKGMNPNVRIIGVESERCASFTAARREGRPIPVKRESTLADGLAVPLVGYNAFKTANDLVDELVVVEEDWIAIAILRLVEQEKAVLEGAGAIGVAAILSGKLEHLEGKKVVVLLCGGNIDTTVLGRCLERGLAAEGRLVKFSVRVSDRPGGISELVRYLADLSVSIKDIVHERAWLSNDVYSVRVLVVCETRDWEHTNQLMTLLNSTYNDITWSAVTHPPGKVSTNF